jgi:hypothetical protein
MRDVQARKSQLSGGAMKHFVTTFGLGALLLWMAAPAQSQDLLFNAGQSEIYFSSGGRLVIDNPTTGRGMSRWVYFILAESKNNVYNFDDSVATVVYGFVDSAAVGWGADYVATHVSSPAMGTLGSSPLGSTLHHIMKVYLWKDLKGVLVSFRYKNTGQSPVTGNLSLELYPRIDQAYTPTHSLRWNSTEKIVYYFRTGLAHYVGAKYLGGDPSGVKLSTGASFYVSGTVAESQPDSIRHAAAGYTAFDASLDSVATGLRSMIHLNVGNTTIAAGDSTREYYFAVAYDVTESGMMAAVNAVAAKYVPVAVRRVEAEVPTAFGLHQNYPNPFNPTTTILVDLRERTSAVLTVSDALGRQVAELMNGTWEAGRWSVPFDASGLTSGVYYYTLRTPQSVVTRRMMLVR